MANDKLKNVIWYLSTLAPGLNMGQTQMLKTILFAEVNSLIFRSRPIVGDIFVRAPHGPVPDGWQEALDELEAEGKIKVVKPRRPYGRTKFICADTLDDADFKLAPGEADVLRRVAETVCNNFAATMISDLTHNEYWAMLADGEQIPVAAYFPRRKPPCGEADKARMLDGLRELGYVR